MSEASSIITVRNLSVFYGKEKALDDINLEIPENRVTAFIGPSGCGKSTFLKSLNRMNDFVEGCYHTGSIHFLNQNLHTKKLDTNQLRKQIGMVFQKPTAFRKTIFENVAYGLRADGQNHFKSLVERVEWALQKAALWDEVKDNLFKPATNLSGGQQQRLCIARSIALEPKILLLDEPTSALDPNSTAKVEELIKSLVKSMTIIIVTHNMQQAKRISDFTAFFYLGKLIEYDMTNTIFDSPKDERTKRYVRGEFG